MKFLADENVEKPIVDWLSEKEHEVSYIAEMAPSVTDKRVIEMARESSMVLLTNDKDFGELVYRQGKVPSGVLLIRARNQTSRHKIKLIKQVLEKAEEKLRNNFVVVNESGIRIRPFGD